MDCRGIPNETACLGAPICPSDWSVFISLRNPTSKFYPHTWTAFGLQNIHILRVEIGADIKFHIPL